MPIPRLGDVKYRQLCQFLKVSAETIFAFVRLSTDGAIEQVLVKFVGSYGCLVKPKLFWAVSISRSFFETLGVLC